eukprot:TRINITY_DN773_c0_g1_i3.p1 TRINITY_DN773_c0_g1~~TRINITY_DN773_c0_g1_i3.p1  ORF type:complete len:1030 (+),score=162.50 TRINITY_DN773_c0_g1_i3:38-3127(+)
MYPYQAHNNGAMHRGPQGMNPQYPGTNYQGHGMYNQPQNVAMQPGYNPGYNPSMTPGMRPGMNAGMNPGMNHGMNPAMNHNMNHGMNHGMSHNNHAMNHNMNHGMNLGMNTPSLGHPGLSPGPGYNHNPGYNYPPNPSQNYAQSNVTPPLPGASFVSSTNPGYPPNTFSHQPGSIQQMQPPHYPQHSYAPSHGMGPTGASSPGMGPSGLASSSGMGPGGLAPSPGMGPSMGYPPGMSPSANMESYSPSAVAASADPSSMGTSSNIPPGYPPGYPPSIQIEQPITHSTQNPAFGQATLELNGSGQKGSTSRVARSEAEHHNNQLGVYKQQPRTEEDLLVRELNGKLRSLKRKTAAVQSMAITQGPITQNNPSGVVVANALNSVAIALPIFHPIHHHALFQSADPAPPGLECDICGSEIFGTRYECDPCDFDLCSACFVQTQNSTPENYYSNSFPVLPHPPPPSFDHLGYAASPCEHPSLPPHGVSGISRGQNSGAPSSVLPSGPPPSHGAPSSVLPSGPPPSGALSPSGAPSSVLPSGPPSSGVSSGAPPFGAPSPDADVVIVGMPVSQPQKVDLAAQKAKAQMSAHLGAKEEAWLRQFEQNPQSISASIMEDESDIVSMLRKLRTKEPHVVRAVFDRIDLVSIFTLLHDCDSKKFRSEACELICTHHIFSINVKGRATIIGQLYPGRFESVSKEHLTWLTNVICSNSKQDLTEFKNRVDHAGMHRNLYKLIYVIMKQNGLGYKADLLRHIGNNIPPPTVPHNNRTPQRIKILSDVDDTFLCSGGSWPAGCDTSYPLGIPYPGVFQFYKELDMGTNPTQTSLPYPTSNLVFITSRPCPKGHAETKVYKRLLSFRTEKRASLHTNPILMTGEVTGSTKLLWGNMSDVAKKKKDNVMKYNSLYPEYKSVWIGDSGQGDYQAAVLCLEVGAIVAAFIHKVTTLDKTYGYKGENKNIFFYDTFIGAALLAQKAGFIDEEAVARVVKAAKEDFEEIISNTKICKKMNTKKAAEALNNDISTVNSTLHLSCTHVRA